MRGGLINVIIGLMLNAGGVSGKRAPRGTESRMALVAIGGALPIGYRMMSTTG